MTAQGDRIVVSRNYLGDWLCRYRVLVVVGGNREYGFAITRRGAARVGRKMREAMLRPAKTWEIQ